MILSHLIFIIFFSNKKGQKYLLRKKSLKSGHGYGFLKTNKKKKKNNSIG